MAKAGGGGGGGGGLMKFGLLLWKNYILQKRHRWQTFFEIFVPLLFTLLLVQIRAQIDAKVRDEPTYYPEFDPRDHNQTFVDRGTFILYAPNTNAEARAIMEQAINQSFSTWNYQLHGFATEADLVREYFNNPLYAAVDNRPDKTNENPVLASVIFQEGAANEIKYQIRFPASHHGTSEDDSVTKPRWMTELLYSLFQVPGPRDPVKNETDLDDDDDWDDEQIEENIYHEHGGSPGYWRQGFLYLQAAIDRAIITLRLPPGEAEDKLDEFDVRLNRYPFPSYIDDIYVIALRGNLPMFLVFSYIYSVVNIAKSIVHEKERRLKESMKMMGLPNWLHWLAWFIKYFIFLVITTILMTVLFKVKMFDGRGILTYADSTLLFCFLLCYLFSVITLGFLVSSFFSTANAASTASGVIFFVTYIPYMFLENRYNDLSKSAKLSISLLSNTGLAFGCQVITMFEGTGAGISWATIAEGATPDDDLSMLDLMLMLVGDGFIYLILAIYIEAVFPGEYGVPLPWYFPFTKWYWCGETRGDMSTSVDNVEEDNNNSNALRVFEKEPKGRAGIKIMGLKKTFGKKVAVDNLNLNLYENQVTALLGHNGAGKTTTMSMITGLFPPTSGSVLVNGYDIRTDMEAVRLSLGLCPQHDVLFDEMTVEEHLRFFCLLKGNPRSQVQAEIDRMLVALKLEKKRHAQSQTLSGGMKRKLSVGIALIGGSKVVLLDEPTSGMDPGARRSTWDLISNEKKGRTIILSTHFMDEADLLGDRIAIMAHGKVICCGSSLFLKKKYGGGYHLIMVKQPHCRVDKITHLLQKYMPEVNVDQNIGTELSYSLPDTKAHLFPEVFEKLERRKAKLGIASYGCSITQMEEVFMRVGEQVEEERTGKRGGHQDFDSFTSQTKGMSHEAVNIDMVGNKTMKMTSSSRSTPGFRVDMESDQNKPNRNTGMMLLLQQLWSMIVKKAIYAWNSKILLFFQTALPVIFLIIALIMSRTLPNVKDPEPRNLDLTKYTQLGSPVTTLECSPTDPLCRAYSEVAALQSSVVHTDSATFEDYIVAQSEVNLPRVNFQYIVGLKMYDNGGRTMLKGFFNNQPYHSAPVALNFVTNSLLRNLTGNNQLKLTVSNYPMAFTEKDKINNLGNAFNSEGFQIGMQIAFGMSFLAASFVLFIIKERETRSKHLQQVSGVKFPIFWLAHFLFDAFNFLFPCLALVIVILAFQNDDFGKSAKMIGLFFLYLLIYGWSVIPLMYLFSFLFTVPSSGYTRMTFFNILTGIVTILLVTIMSIPELNLTKAAEAMEWAFMILPNFNVGYGIARLATNRRFHDICPNLQATCEINPDFDCCKNYPVDYLAWRSPGVGRNVIYMLGVGFLCFLWLFIIESKITQKISFQNEGKKYQKMAAKEEKKKQAKQAKKDKKKAKKIKKDLKKGIVNEVIEEEPEIYIEDSDVMAENERVRLSDMKTMMQNETMVLRDLTKYYEKFLAVDGLCLGVQHGECFGLLGVNGAGKTTTFKMLTGDIPITLGEAYVIGKSVKTQIKEVQRGIGYCPQFDALIPELTGRETIRLFARLRGIPEAEIDGLVDKLGADLIFTEHMEKPCGTYSGGNKRKLSTALSLVGGPPIMFLDEPTTGMDPVARRHVWNAVIKARETGTSVVLTSHSMEECEALCTRLAIMVNGKFRCLGSTQHLKNKFGNGYTLIAQIEMDGEPEPEGKKLSRMMSTELQRRGSSMRTRADLERRRSSAKANKGQVEKWEEDLQPLRSFIEYHFRGCELKDIHPAYVHYHIPEDGTIKWSDMFRRMEEAKRHFRLEAYSIGQTSLEQVFLGFAKGQGNEDEDDE